MLFAIGPVVATAALLIRRARRRQRLVMAQVGVGPNPTPRPAPGISDVDPEALANPAAEGIDIEATAHAHRAVRDQRDKLPIRGDNVP